MQHSRLSSASLPWAGLILAGGRSVRMGRDKASLPWQGQTLLEVLVQQVGAVVRPVAVAAAAGQTLPRLPAWVHVLRDSVPTEGPLRGVHEGLRHFQHTAQGVLVVPVDAATVEPGLLALLIGQCTNVDIVVGTVNGQPQPLPGCYSVSLLPHLEARLQAGQRSLVGLLESSPHLLVPEMELRRVDPELRSYWPLNTPADLARLRERERQSVE